MLYAGIELILSLFAVFGLFSLGYLLFGRLLRPSGACLPAYIVVPASGDGGGLEQTVRSLLWWRAGGSVHFTLVLADGGLSPVGLALARALVRRESGVVLCPAVALAQLIAPRAT